MAFGLFRLFSVSWPGIDASGERGTAAAVYLHLQQLWRSQPNDSF